MCIVLVLGQSVCACFDFVIIAANCTILESLRLTHQKIKKKKTQQRDYKMKQSHIENFTLKMLIIEWTTVTFCSATLLTNKYREGVSSVKTRSTSPQWCVCIHTNSVMGFDLVRI